MHCTAQALQTTRSFISTFPSENCWLNPKIGQENILPHIWVLNRRTWTLPWSPQWRMGCRISWSCRDVLLHCDPFRDTASVCKHWILSLLWWMLDLSMRVSAVNQTKKWSPIEATGIQPLSPLRPETCREEKVNSFPYLFFQLEYLQDFSIFQVKVIILPERKA